MATVGNYKCGRCGLHMSYYGACPNCSGGTSGTWGADMMEVARSAGTMATGLHYGIWHDRGCCGCNVHRRRLVGVVLTVIYFVAGLAIIGAGNTFLGMCFLGGAAFFFGFAAVCPNGCCCVHYTDNKEPGTITVNELQMYKQILCSHCSDGAHPPGAGAALADSAGALGTNPAEPLMGAPAPEAGGYQPPAPVPYGVMP
jgi:hypothetical protein